jgi:hypothetical protein
MTIRTAEDMREAVVGICAALLKREYDAETGDHVYGILDAIRALPVASEWRPISEHERKVTNPPILIIGPRFRHAAIAFWAIPYEDAPDSEGFWRSGKNVHLLEHVSHFMEIPLPPHVAPEAQP